jgi:hypothetical protein
MATDTGKELLKSVRSLECCCCGELTRGRQWWNRDTGYGICGKCIQWLRTPRTSGRNDPRESEEQIRDYYGIEGVHFNVSA